MSLPVCAYDSKDLQLFLLAHVMRAGADATDRPPQMRREDEDRLAAERAERERLRLEANVSFRVFQQAIGGKAVGPEARYRLWRALGIDPLVAEDGP